KMTLDYKAKTMTFVPTKYEPTDALQSIVTLIMTPGDAAPKPVAASGQWGLVVRKSDKDAAAGVTIETVMPGGAAAAAGLEAGGRLLTLDGRWTDSVMDTYLAASFVKPGTTVVVTVQRDGKEMEVTVRPNSGL